MAIGAGAALVSLIGAGFAVDQFEGDIAAAIEVQGREITQLACNGRVHSSGMAVATLGGADDANFFYMFLVAVGSGCASPAIGVVRLAKGAGEAHTCAGSFSTMAPLAIK